MGKLIFRNVAAVKELYDHVKACKSHRKTYGEETGAGLWLVHDQGVYLMSPGIPHLEREDSHEAHKVVYAEGCSPKDDDFWEEARSLVGGDDFVEHIPIDTWDKMFSRKAPLVRIELVLTEKSLSVTAVEMVAPCRLPQEPVGVRELDDIV